MKGPKKDSTKDSTKVEKSHPASIRIPLATYRLQFNAQFTLRHATALLDYLRDLGISDCYASPLFKAGAQSTHGYDICAFDQLNPNLGTLADFERFTAKLKRLGMGLLLDMVPNHMRADSSNRWWRDVLEKGPASPYASWFDIDWRPSQSDLRDKVLLPILEDDYPKVLEAGKLRVVFEAGQWVLAYYDQRFPLVAPGVPPLHPMERGQGGEVRAHTRAPFPLPLPEGEGRGEGECSIPIPTSTGSERRPSSDRPLSSPLSSPLSNPPHEPPSARGLEVGANAEPSPSPRPSPSGRGGPVGSSPQLSPAALDSLLRQQHYRLACWRVAGEQINYRRFFDVTELVSLRMELPQVFEATHRFLFSLLDEGKVSGLRIDHPDGLWNPRQYFERLQQHRRCYVVAEKILTDDELLPADWPVHGTTGYDFLNCVNRLFVNPANRQALDDIYRDFVGSEYEPDFKAIVRASKLKLLRSSFAGELSALTHRLRRLAAGTPLGQGLTSSRLRRALAEVIAAFPVYRTYITEDTLEVAAPCKRYIQEAVRAARANAPNLDASVFDFLKSVLLRLGAPASLPASCRRRREESLNADCSRKEDSSRRLLQSQELAGKDAGTPSASARRDFILRFQQLTGPVMAKGLEDTAFYTYNRLLSLNDVGGDPDAFGTSLREYHQRVLDSTRWPHSMLATATHDTKRGEDARARINVLSEMPEVWRQAVTRWTAMNAGNKVVVDGRPAPSANDEYLLYQTLVGAWSPEAEAPDGPEPFAERIAAYMLKAIREAKAHTSWLNPNPAYEDATRQFVHRLCRRRREESPSTFLDDFAAFHRKVAFFGQFNSLSQVLLKLTSPGVPDFYQGTELWDLSLVDPDNRRPVDYDSGRSLLRALKRRWPPAPGKTTGFFRELLQTSETGQLKLFLIWRALEFRHAHRGLFDSGAYVPLFATGPKLEHVCAFARVLGSRQVIVIVPRLVFGLVEGAERAPLGREVWQDTELPLPGTKPGSRFLKVLTGEELTARKPGARLSLHQALHLYPVALLQRVS